jgi:PleD family two-component response regulator
MKNVLVVGENIKEINKLRRSFGFDFKVSATNSPDNAVSILQKKTNDLAVYHASEDLSLLFNFYRSLRASAATEKLPLLVIADATVLKALNDTVEMAGVTVIGRNLSEDEMTGVVNSMLGS